MHAIGKIKPQENIDTKPVLESPLASILPIEYGNTNSKNKKRLIRIIGKLITKVLI